MSRLPFGGQANIDGSDRPRRMNRQALSGVFVQQGEDAKDTSIFDLVGHKIQLHTWPGRSARCRSAVEIPKRFMRRCFLLTLIPSSRRIRATHFALTSKPCRTQLSALCAKGACIPL